MSKNALIGTLLDEQATVSMSEICLACSCRSEWVLELVNEGILEPQARERDEWYFSAISLPVAQAAQRLERDLGVNIAGVALALELLEEIRFLRAQLQQP
ncbi:MAG: chaperone modulator CbpM [Gammaproteobacteria bacterium]|nr:chaperone modulator CbpM [Gammaproteobacteria bacterium]MDH5303115.1 chaperone modulator CbpM [Gammaproteobacteria bacterium]MDH5322163.1 chaperone modulator CbpM [Gammaproteobacteria bacterium]